MTRAEYIQFARENLDKHNLKTWSIRLNQNADSRYLGLCSYKDKTIILNAHHLDIHPELSVKNTILHEIAHALAPGCGHNEVWAARAREIGCDNTLPCSNLGLTPQVIDAIRSGAQVEIDYEEHVIRTPKYKITQLQDRCPECGKVAKEKVSWNWVDKKSGSTFKCVLLECLHTIKTEIPKGTPFETMVSNDWRPEVKNCKHKWGVVDSRGITIENQCQNCNEYKLYPFQIEGAKFLEAALLSSKGGAIFDEMGLGKTPQSLAPLKFHDELFPVLFVVKSGIKFQWAKEIMRWLGRDFMPQVIETGKHYVFPGLKCYIISYDLIRRIDIEKMIKPLGIKTVILDECQQIKNVDSSRTQGVRILAKEAKVIGLSGTPWKNRGSEFFSILNMLNPVKFYSFEAFCKVWVDYYYEGARRKEGGIKNPKRFREEIKDIAIRRERSEVAKQIPTTNRTKLHIQMEKDEQSVYDTEIDKFGAWYNEFVQEGTEDSIDSIQLLARLSRMRHLVGLAKIPATVEFVQEFIDNETDKKIVVFVHHKDVGEIILSDLKKTLKCPVLQMHSGLSGEERFKLQERFNSLKQCVMVASTLAAGEGLNLQTCADCVMHERQWNPGNEQQAEDRFARIGQLAPRINATYTEAENSVDSHFDGIVETKRSNYHVVMNKGEKPKWNEASLIKELANRVFEDFKNRNKKRMSK